LQKIKESSWTVGNQTGDILKKLDDGKQEIS
jgi:hypothetical protein